MAYCPQCGREQRCGCDECHLCGVPLVHGRAAPRHVARAAPDAARSNAVTRPSEPENLLSLERPRQVSINWIVHVFIILGTGILIVTCLEMANTGAHFPAVGPFSTLGEGLRRAGYYFGVILYTSSVRLMTGFALMSAGFLIARRSIARPGWDKAVRATGLVMSGVGIVFMLTALDLILPLGTPPYALTAVLPPLWAAVPILVATGVALFGAGYLMATRLSSERKKLSLRFGDRAERAARRARRQAADPRELLHGGESSGAEEGAIR